MWYELDKMQPIYLWTSSALFYPSLQFDLHLESSHHHPFSWCLASLFYPGLHNGCAFHVISPPVISPHCGISAGHMILFTFTLFHISCILSLKVTALFTTPLPLDLQMWGEYGGGDCIRLGHGLWRMIGWACTRLHLWNLIFSGCWEFPDKLLKVSRCGRMHWNATGLGGRKKNGWNWEDRREREEEGDLQWC